MLLVFSIHKNASLRLAGGDYTPDKIEWLDWEKYAMEAKRKLNMGSERYG